MMNPVTYARISAGYSKAEFPRVLDVSRTYTIRSEQGCYVRPSHKIVDFSCATLQISISQFMRQYREFQHDQRIRAIAQFNLEPIKVKDMVLASPPVEGERSELSKEFRGNQIYMNKEFTKWRSSYFNSVINFSAQLCLHPTSVNDYEAGKYKSLPDQMNRVLNETKLIGNLNPDRLWVWGV